MNAAVVGVIGWCAGAAVAAAPPALTDVEELQPLVERWTGFAEDLGIGGYAIALIKDGELLAAEGFGVRDAEEAEPVDADTMYYIASCTKTYVAAAIVDLAHQGTVDLDHPVTRYLPEFILADGSQSSVTLRDLLGHKKGLNSGTAVQLDAYTGTITDDRYFHWLAEEASSGDIQYTNVNFTLLGRVIERVSGQSWRNYLDEHLFTPAGMHRTTGYATEMYTDANAAFPQVLGDDGLERAEMIKNDAVMHAAGGLGTSALDAARWLMLHINEGRLDGRQVLPAAVIEEALTAQSSFPSTRGRLRAMEGFAAGWQRGTWAGGPKYYQHGGGYVGTSAHLSMIPEEGLGVVVLVNLSPEGIALHEVLSIDYYDHMLGVEEPHDFLEQYGDRIKDYRAREDEPAPPRLTSAALSLPARSYLGRFSNTWMGEIEIAFRQGELAGRMGNYPITLHAAPEGGADRCLFLSGGNAADLRFVIDQGTVVAIEVTDDGDTARYDRVR